jgi:CubicO group peptidase (beta-lactamase class C family)
MMNKRWVVSLAAALAVAAAAIGAAGEQSQTLESRVDRVFARWNGRTPGCAVGVSLNGKSVLEKGYGLADLEHDVANRADTIFEAGSVSKQFTAAAVLLLARDGRLSLDDPVRKYIPELPDYGAPLTIRHMLNHTSGLRDWGSVAGIAGWPRTTRVYTHAHVLDIVSRQRSLNFPSGTRYSYSNTGYNLATVIVSRVSGESFPEFSRARIFSPLGMTRTSWRDDFRRVVKGRAIAYSDAGGGFRMNMPFEDVHGNGGLLTTVGDLLRWIANFAHPVVGDAAFVREQQQPGRFNDGRQHGYALGLMIGTYKGVREVGHSGSTAGYRAHLVDYPDQKVSVGVLCNVSSGAATQAAHEVADLYLGEALAKAVRAADPADGSATRYVLKRDEIENVTGLYRNTETGEPMRIVLNGDILRIEGGAALRAESGSRFIASNGRGIELETGGRLQLIDAFGSVEPYERVEAAALKPRPLGEYAGAYVSDEAEVSVMASVENDTLVLKRRPDSTIRLTPVYADGFRGSIGFVRFHRDAGGQVTGLSVSQARVWDLRFNKRAGG